MKKLFLISAVLLTAISSAQSADLQRAYTKAPIMAPVASWTGFYAGLNVGYGFKDPTVIFSSNDPGAGFVGGGAGGGAPSIIPPASYDVKGVLGGAQIGYNWQVSPQWLVGLEADFQGSDVKGSTATPYTLIGGNPFQANTQQNVDWFGTLRARTGWLANDKLLVFATGGLAYGSVHESAGVGPTTAGGAIAVGVNCSGAIFAGLNCFAGNQTKVQTGYTAGGGLEYALWQNVTFKVEYLYVNLGSSTLTAVAQNSGGATPSTFNVHFSDLDFNVVRAGVNYRF